MERFDIAPATRPDSADMPLTPEDHILVGGLQDHVTGLPTRLAFLRNLDPAGGDAAGGDAAGPDAAAPDAAGCRVRAGGGAALMLVTLAEARHFNEMLRALGHAFTEDFVRIGFAAIRATLPPGTPVYHVSVLSLAFLVAESASPHSAAAWQGLAEALVRRFATPMLCQDVPIAVQIGIGVAALDADHPAEALRAALSAAQDSRRSTQGWALYDRKSDLAHRRAFTLLADLQQTLGQPLAVSAPENPLSLHYQGRLSVATGQCVGAEALLRWRHPRLGAISPGEFIPLAETTALIGPLTDWVLRAGLAQAAAWHAQGEGLVLSMNVAPHNLDQRNFVPRLAAALRRARLDPTTIELEFTEGTLARDIGLVREQLQAVRALGVGVAIDDFGTGYSSLGYLKEIPATVVKIDRSFVQDLSDDPRDQILVRAMISIAHEFGYRVVAEGIETAANYDMLAKWGCDEVQGYLFCRPIDAASFTTWRRTDRARDRAILTA